MEYNIKLENYNGIQSRYTCPLCGKEHEFTRYIDTRTGEYIHETVGRCNRENKCGYHYPPRQYFTDNDISYPINGFSGNTIQESDKKINTPSYLSWDHLDRSIQFNKDIKKIAEKNNFISYLLHFFQNEDTVKELCKKYYIGTMKLGDEYFTIFWQFTGYGIRTGKIMLYDPTNGKRKGDISWIHKVLKLPDYNMVQCFFGEHLLRDNEKKIVIVESEKTAIIASQFYPDYVWLACGSINGLNEEKCRVLQGREVVLIPDLKAYKKWNNKAGELSHITSFKVCNVLEHIAKPEEKKEGLDIADYLLREIRYPHILEIGNAIKSLFNA